MTYKNSIHYTFKRAMLAVICGVSSVQAWSCGGGIFWTVLDNRADVLRVFPENYFRDDMDSLVQSRTELPRIAVQAYAYDQQPVWFEKDIDASDPLYELKRLNNIEKKYFGKGMAVRVFALRQLDYPTLLNTDSVGLTPAIQLYLYGAAAFHEKNFEQAISYFNEVIELDDRENPIYSLWARYSLARSYAGLEQYAQAQQAFIEVRHFVQQHPKTPDELRLVLGSLGEQARVHMQQGDYNRAIELYAQQNAQGDRSGEASLVIVAKKLMNMPMDELQQQLQTPYVQRVMIAWLLATTDQNNVYYIYEDSNQDKELSKVKAIIRYLVRHAQIAEDQQALFAKMLYQQGMYAEAAALLPHVKESGITWWLTAKLALRDGDINKARQAYAKAANYFPQQEEVQPEQWTARPNEFCRINAESAILSLKQNDFAEAMQQLWYGRDFYWDDIAHVAERVLSTRQLIAFVEKNAPEPDSKLLTDRNQDGKVDEYDQYYPLPIEQRLRNLLARRLMREKHYDQAMLYFDPEIRSYARTYGKEYAAAQRTWQMDVQRAAHYFAAARVMREHGMQIVGYEGSPDNASSDGAFPPIADQSMIKENRTWMSGQEISLMQQTRARPDLRYHYRTVAASLAQQAAGLVPERSQAYAAALCFASRWTAYSDPRTAQQSYRQYLKYGAYVPWGRQFGSRCPEPEFGVLWYKQLYYPWLELKQELRPYKQLIYWGIFVLLLGGFVGLYRLFVHRPKV